MPSTVTASYNNHHSVGRVASLTTIAPWQPRTPRPHAPHGLLPEGGTVRPITRWGTAVMHRPQQPVTSYDDSLAALAADMVATMYAADGVGLAACQIGEDVAMFVFDCPDDAGAHTVGVVCNPVLTLPEGRERHLDDGDEGCLSFPGRLRRVRRAPTGRGSTEPASTASR